MSQIDAKSLYLQFKKGERAYNEETHCPMIIDVMNNEGTAVAFMRKAQISDTLFYKWLKKHKVFRECYAYAKIISRDNWEKEGEEGKEEEFFNFDLWRMKGAMRYGIGKNRVRFGVDPKASPYVQYQQLVELANSEEFNASEIKQLMESINVGIRAFETFELQGEINNLKDMVTQLGLRDGNNINAIEKAAKTD
jgi:hypothetical protein